MASLPINRAAQLDIRAITGTLLAGMAVRLSGDLSDTNTYNAELVSTADGNVDAVVRQPASDVVDGSRAAGRSIQRSAPARWDRCQGRLPDRG